MSADRPATERPKREALLHRLQACARKYPDFPESIWLDDIDAVVAEAAQGAAPLDWWKRIGEWVHDHAIYTKDRPDNIEVQPLYAFLDDLMSEGAAPRAEGPPHKADCPLLAEGIEHEGFCPSDERWRIRAAPRAEGPQVLHAEWWYATGRCAERHADLPKIERPCGDCQSTAHDVVPPAHFPDGAAPRAEALEHLLMRIIAAWGNSDMHTMNDLIAEAEDRFRPSDERVDG